MVYESYEIQVITPTPESITFKWELISNSFNSNWSYSICDYTGCYVGFPNAATMSPITSTAMAGGTFGFIKCNITCGSNYDEGLAQIYIYDANDYNRGDTISFHIVWSTPFGSISENSINISTYPNPCVEELNISNTSSARGTFTLTDLLGKVRYTASIGSKQTKKLDVSNYINGVYILSFHGENGISSTKKIIKK